MALLACARAACLFPALDGLTGEDASIDASVDATSVDGGDASTSDAKSDGALGDAKADGDAGGGTFCATQDATFCADFDESSDVTSGFSSLYLTDGGVVGLDDATASSPPDSLLAGNLVLGSGGSSHACVVTNTTVTPTTSLVLDMDMRVDQLASQGTYIEAFAIVFESATQSSIQFNLKSASAEVGEEMDALDGGKTYISHPFPGPMAMDVWTHVNITLAVQAPRTITVTVGTTVVVDHSTMNAAFVFGPTDLYAGNAYAPGPSDGARVHYDNLVLHLD
jgi:hypothetical protein